MNFYECLNVIWWWCIWCNLLRACKFYECLNVIDDDVYDATHCENEEFYEYLKYY